MNMSAVVTFEDSVKERLKSIVADLIPEDRWNGIVQATVQDFEKNDLPKLVKAELTEQYKKAIAAEFAKPEWQAQWNSAGAQIASEGVSKLIVEAAPLVLASMIGGAVQQVTYNLQSAMQSGRGY
jgi:hypothetical protein